nr:hypothetical protein 4 [Paracoccaceae bacterium]
MKKIVLFVFLGLFTSGVLAEERKVVLVATIDDAAQAEAGAVLRGTMRYGKENVGRILEIAAKHCDLRTFQFFDYGKNYFWICEKA